MKFPSLILLLLIGPAFALGAENQDKDALPIPGANLNPPYEKSVWGLGDEQIDELFEQSSDLVGLVDPQYLHRINSSWTNLLGWDEHELCSRPFVEFMHPEDIADTKFAANRATRSSIVHNPDAPLEQKTAIPMLIGFQNRYRTKEGGCCLLEWLVFLQVSGPNTYPPMLGIAKDITSQKESEEQKLALERVKIETRMKSTFVAHMSHEIRTPLNCILGFIELALEEEMTSKVRSYLQQAHESALLLLEIANDIVDVSRMEAGALKIENADFNPVTSFQSVVNILNLQAQKKKIVLTSLFSSSLPSSLKGDQNRFKQILFNLGSNAIKFTSQGKVSIKIDGQPHPQHPHLFVLRGRVKDTGIGMEAEFIKHLFQPFSQENRSLNRQSDGAGLGLYITRQLCGKMGGTVSVLSTPGLGSTFQFQLLLEQSSCSSSVGEILPIPASLKLPVTRILVVDDNIMNQKMLTLVLTHLGCVVDTVEDGHQAIKAIQDKVYELVFMDGEMPHLDGLEATKIIRQQFSRTQLPIIGLTAHAMTNHRQQFLEVGMNGYLTKPIKREKLIKEIFRCFETP